MIFCQNRLLTHPHNHVRRYVCVDGRVDHGTGGDSASLTTGGMVEDNRKRKRGRGAAALRPYLGLLKYHFFRKKLVILLVFAMCNPYNS